MQNVLHRSSLQLAYGLRKLITRASANYPASALFSSALPEPAVTSLENDLRTSRINAFHRDSAVERAFRPDIKALLVDAAGTLIRLDIPSEPLQKTDQTLQQIASVLPADACQLTCLQL